MQRARLLVNGKARLLEMVRSRGEAASLLQRRPAVYLRAGTRREGHADARHTRKLVRLAVGQ